MSLHALMQLVLIILRCSSLQVRMGNKHGKASARKVRRVKATRNLASMHHFHSNEFTYHVTFSSITFDYCIMKNQIWQFYCMTGDYMYFLCKKGQAIFGYDSTFSSFYPGGPTPSPSHTQTPRPLYHASVTSNVF